MSTTRTIIARRTAATISAFDAVRAAIRRRRDVALAGTTSRRLTAACVAVEEAVDAWKAASAACSRINAAR